MRTEFLNITIHDDAELEAILGGKISLREKLHHWPLSYVEKVTMEDGARLVYKTQNSDSSVEAAFYSRASAPFLTRPIYTGTLENCTVLIMPFFDYPPLDATDLSGADFEQIISDISTQIQTLGDIPVYFDISSQDKLIALTDGVCNVFQPDEVAAVKGWVRNEAHVCYDKCAIGNVHGDLSLSNILAEDGRPRVIIDWQRPMKAPVLLESAIARLLLADCASAAAAELSGFDLLARLVHFVWYAHAYGTCLPIAGVLAQAKRLLREIVSVVRGG